MSHLSTSIVVEAPADRVFELIADPGRAPEWQTLDLELGPVAGRPGGVGTSFLGSYRVAGRRLEGHFVVTAAEPPTLFELTGTTPGGWVRWTTLLEPLPAGCEVRVAVEYELPGELVTSLFGLVVGNRLRREIARSYRNLKELAEGEAAAAADRNADQDADRPARDARAADATDVTLHRAAG